MQVRMGRVIGEMVAAAIIVATVAGAAHAAPLGLVPGSPDINPTPVTLSYDDGLGLLTATGGVAPFGVSGSALTILNGSFLLNAFIDTAGLFSAAGSSFTINDGAATVLSGDLTSFGSSFGSLEFLFNVTAADPLLGFGSTGGVILSSALLPVVNPLDPASAVDFSAGFSIRNEPTADVFAVAVPEPGTLSLLALAGVAAFRRRRNRA